MERTVTVVDIDCDIKLFIPNYALPNKLAGFKQVLLNDKLTYSSKLVYGQLCEYIGRNLLAWPSVQSISEKLGIGYRTVIAALKLLEHYRLIISIRRGFTKTNLYGLVWQEEFNLELQDIMNKKFSDLDRKQQIVDRSYLQIKADNCTSRGALNASQEVHAVPFIKECINISNHKELNTTYLMADGKPSDQGPPPIPQTKTTSQLEAFDSQRNTEKCDYVKSETGRVIELVRDNGKAPSYKREVHELFEYWNTMGVRPIHRVDSQSGKNCLEEIHRKLRNGITKSEFIEVFEKYKKAQNHPQVKARMNKGKPINLFSLLDNRKYGGILDWWEFFRSKSIEEIVDHYVKGRRDKSSINQIDYDDRPDLTKKIAMYYAKNVLGDPSAIDFKNFGTDPRYEKFKEAGRKASAVWKKNKNHPLFKTETSILEILIRALRYENPTLLITAGHLASDNTWNTVLPGYLKAENISGIRWR